jgi:copper transport protein
LLRAFVFLWITDLLVFASPPGNAFAHANLDGSEPEQGVALAEAPPVISLEYSEELDPRLSRVQLVDVNSQVIVEGPGEVDLASPRILTLELPALSDGAYSAVWQVRSAVDGHITRGSVNFSVGAAGPRPSLLPPPGAPEPATALPSPLDTVIRWMSFLAGALLVGAALFGPLVWRPAFLAWEGPDEGADRSASRLLQRLVQLGSMSLILLTLAGVVYGATQASVGVDAPLFRIAFFDLLGGHTGRVVLSRLAVLGLAALLARQLPPAGRGPARAWWEVSALGLGALLTISLQSHSAAQGSPLAVAVDWLHLAAMSAWIGGLAPLFLLILRTGLPAGLLVPRFSRVALASVVILTLTGLYSAYQHVGSLGALAETTYGRTLSAKGVFTILIIAFGAVNLLVLSPRLSSGEPAAARRLRGTVRFELILASFVLLASGVMTAVSPAREALQAQRRLGILQTARIGEVQMKLRVAPGQAGENEFGVDILDNRPGAAQVAGQVLLRINSLAMDMGTTQVETVSQDGRRYLARGSYLSMGGLWQVEVILRKPRFDDVRKTYEIQLQLPPEESTLPNPIPADAASISQGERLYEQNCLPCHGPQGKGDGPVGRTLNPRPSDLSQHTLPGLHPDGQLFEWISKGYPGSVMPAFEGTLTEEQRWHLVNYIRTLSESTLSE